MKTYAEQEVVELLKKFNRQQTRNVNSDKWYLQWIQKNKNMSLINLENERPRIADFFPKEITIKQVYNSFLKNEELCNYITALDNYTDFLESQIYKMTNYINNMRTQLEEKVVDKIC